MALSASGSVYAWGRGGFGQLGLGATDNTCRPAVVGGALSGVRVVQIAAGQRHSVALSSNNAVYTWGSGEQGQLGCGQVVDKQLSPRLVEGLPDGCAVLYVSSGKFAAWKSHTSCGHQQSWCLLIIYIFTPHHHLYHVYLY